MSTGKKLPLVTLLCVFGTAFAQAQAPPPPEEQMSLGDVARRYRAPRSAKTVNGEEQYQSEISALLAKRAFDELDRAADQARTSKERFPGGVWKLYMFYEALAKPPAGDEASEFQWKAHIATLKDWVARQPTSITARVALAEAYLGRGYAARGGGWASTVSEEGWKTLGENVALAQMTLADATNLKAKCPHWFVVMQGVALAGGLEPPEARRLFEAAISFEPDYYQYYREYANYLLPKWYGEEGDAEAFANETLKRVPGKQGLFLYFEIASVIFCQCTNTGSPSKVSWPKIKEGHAALEELYGTSYLKLNRLGLMANMFGDRETLRTTMQRIGDHWEEKVWSRDLFFGIKRSLAREDAAKGAAVQ